MHPTSSWLQGCVTDDFGVNVRPNDDVGTSYKVLIENTIDQHDNTRVDDSGFCTGDDVGIYLVNYDGDTPGELLVEDNQADNYKFKATQGNSEYSVGNVKKAEVLWETFGTEVMPNVGDLIASVGYKNGYVYFSTPETFKSGNASIAVRNSRDVILWSWHIWCSAEGWIDHVYPNNAGTMMDRNLGATSATPGDVGAFGLLYQWGRKDPFMGSGDLMYSTLAAATGNWAIVNHVDGVMLITINYAEENPTTYIAKGPEWCDGIGGGGESDYTKRWMESKKTMYDPCPVGYRVPNGGENGFWATANAPGVGDYEDYLYKGISLVLEDGKKSWYPMTGERSSDDGSLLFEINGCWSATSNGYWSAYGLAIFESYITSSYSYERGDGRSVRCVKE